MITEREEFRMIPKFLAYVTEWIVMPFMRSRFFFHLFGKSMKGNKFRLSKIFTSYS